MKNAETETTSCEVSATAWGGLGRTLLVVGKNELAIEALEAAVRKASPDQDGRIGWLVNLGMALLELGRVAEACEALEEAHDMEHQKPGYFDDYYEDDLLPETLRLLQQAANRQEGVVPDIPFTKWGGPEDALSWGMLGRAFGEVYTDAKAIERFAQLLPGDASLALGAWYSLYRPYSIKAPSLAITALERAIALYPEVVNATAYGYPLLHELIEALSVSCLLNNQADKAASCNRRMFEAIRRRSERNPGYNDSNYVFVGDVHVGTVVRIDAYCVTVNLLPWGEFSLPVDDFKNESSEIRIDDFIRVAVETITATAKVVQVGSAYVRVRVEPSGIVSNMSIDSLSIEKASIKVDLDDSIQIVLDNIEDGNGDNDPIFIHRDTVGMQLSFRRVTNSPQFD